MIPWGGAVTRADRLSVQLVRPRTVPASASVWPAAPTVIYASPKAPTNIAAAIVRLMAEAQAQLRQDPKGKMIMKVEDFDDKRLDGLHRCESASTLPVTCSIQSRQRRPLCGPFEQDELDRLNAMLERNASNDEILVTLHEWADLALDEYAKPLEQCAIEYLTTNT